MKVNRRTFLGGAAALASLSASSAHAGRQVDLVAAPGEAGLVVPDGPATKAWLYNGTAPGPVLRARQGEELKVDFKNQLPEPTTVHWHGLRVPVEMDGVPFLSQPPVAPGESFTYRLQLEDAGTFWYHPHVNSSEQVGRGLYGLLIIEELPEAAARLGADREVAWAIDDWRLDDDAQIAPFGSFREMSHAGRIGNVLTVNGTYLTNTELRAGERIRLRLANVANAQTFYLKFAPFDPWLVALDGHPVPPRRLGEDGLWLGAAQRADLVLDVDLDPGETAKVIDEAYGADRAFEVMTWTVGDAAPIRTDSLPPPQMLPPNPIRRPDLSTAAEHRLALEGGAMSGMTGAMMGGKMIGMRELAQAGKMWALNGAVPADIYKDPRLFQFDLGRTQIIALENKTRWAHPIHLHGHSFHVLKDGEDPLAGAEIRDTVLLLPQESARIAFVADNPGKWMLHCHVLEHQAAGMMGVVEVS
ncbi:MAG: multicopper oxidase family protein [Pseudomonadota bacterium]